MSDAAIEAKAKAMGWTPKESFRGDPERFVDAETFLKRGEEVLPIVRAENARLRQQNQQFSQQIQSLSQTVEANQEAIDALKEFNSEKARGDVKALKEKIKADLVQAKKDENHELEVELTDQLGEANEALKEAETEEAEGKKNGKGGKKAPVQQQPNNQQQTPEFKAWHAENPWFLDPKEQRKTNYAIAVANDLATTNKAAGIEMPQTEFLEAISAEVETVFPNPNREKPGKTEGGSQEGGTGGGGGGRSGKSYASLPAEAKAACDSMVSKLVGPGRAFKTKEDWQKKYTADYYEAE